MLVLLIKRCALYKRVAGIGSFSQRGAQQSAQTNQKQYQRTEWYPLKHYKLGQTTVLEKLHGEAFNQLYNPKSNKFSQKSHSFSCCGWWGCGKTQSRPRPSLWAPWPASGTGSGCTDAPPMRSGGGCRWSAPTVPPRPSLSGPGPQEHTPLPSWVCSVCLCVCLIARWLPAALAAETPVTHSFLAESNRLTRGREAA